jgi:serine/threonine-protein kinase
MPDAAPKAPPQKLGPYLLSRQVKIVPGAASYLATRGAAGEPLLIHLPRAKLRAVPEFMRRFEAEAQAAAAVEHPGLLAVRGVETLGGLPALICAAPPGKPLSLLPPGRTLALADVHATLRQMLEALEAAHAAGVLHRSLTPAAVFRTDEGQVLIAGLGVAHPSARERKPAQIEADLVHGFMSPEEARGEMLTARTDFYALGAIAYRLLGGRPPYQETNLNRLKLLISGKTEPAPIRTLNPQIPIPMLRFLQRMMSKDSKIRFLTAGAALHDLGAEAPPDPQEGQDFVTEASEEEAFESESYEVPARARLPRWAIWGGVGALAVLGIITFLIVQTLMIPTVGPPPAQTTQRSPGDTSETSSDNKGGGESVTVTGVNSGGSDLLPTLDESKANLVRKELVAHKSKALEGIANGNYDQANADYAAAVGKINASPGPVANLLAKDLEEIQKLQAICLQGYTALNLLRNGRDVGEAANQVGRLGRLLEELTDEAAKKAWSETRSAAVREVEEMPRRLAYDQLRRVWAGEVKPDAQRVKEAYQTLAEKADSPWTQKAAAEGKPVCERWIQEIKGLIDQREAAPAVALLQKTTDVFGASPWAAELPELTRQVKELTGGP